MKSPALTLVCLLTLFGMPNTQAQWLEWDVQTESRMELFTVATSDEEEKDLWPADLNGDGAVTASDLLDGILANFGQACP